MTIDAKAGLCRGILLSTKKGVRDSKVIDACVLALRASGLMPFVCHSQIVSSLHVD